MTDAERIAELESTIKQMEEALRFYADKRNYEPGERKMGSPVAYDDGSIARAALSPSDTEEVMTQTANEPST